MGESYLYVLRRFVPFLLTILLINLLCCFIMAIPGAPLAGVFVPFLLHPTAQPPVALMVVTGLVCFPLGVLLMLLLIPWVPFATIAFVVEEKRYFAAVRRATRLLRPWYWAQVLLVIVIVQFVAGMITSALTMPFVMVANFHSADALTGTFPRWLQLALGLINGAVSCVSVPLTSGVVILQYYDARIRKEGYDLEVLAQEMGRQVVLPSEPSAPAPQPRPPEEPPREAPAGDA